MNDGQCATCANVRLWARPFLQSVIRESGWRQDHIAAQVGVSKATVTQWVRGGRTLSLRHARALSTLLDEDLGVLVELAYDGKSRADRSNGHTDGA